MVNLEPLYVHQREALQKSIESDFKSGTHFHATGTGKSWLTLYTLACYLEKNITKSSEKPLIIFWICERKNILKEQFSKKLNSYEIYDVIKKHVNIYNTLERRSNKWYESVNSSIFWKKSKLVIINRAFLTSQYKYKNIRIPIDLVLHDECHTISNKTTQQFYEWLLIENNSNARCIGFTATPFYTENIEVNPFKEVLSKFTIYNACIENDVILKPKIERYEIEDLKGKSSTLSEEEMAYIVLERIKNQPYKKIIVWSGMIKHCERIAKIWWNIFKGFKICIDTSVDLKIDDLSTISYDEFYNEVGNCIMFCACKHREGSDIPNLDTCVFLDYVEDRGHLNFIQCVGRVLRKDNEKKKKFGLIIDIKAKSTIKLCDRLCDAFQLPVNVFPWCINNEESYINDKKVKIHLLTVDKDIDKEETIYGDVSEDDLKHLFIRELPDNKRYKTRLKRELKMIINKNLGKYLIQALDILKLTLEIKEYKIPHITRGSCGSSLVCYLLGISHVDPIKYNISFARFLNECRDNLPDIDFDFPYNTRDAIFIKLQCKWPGKIARISNHVHYHEKSAKREALRRAGVKGFIAKGDIYRIEKGLDKEAQDIVKNEMKKLVDTFKCYSLHCGGIVYYEEGIPRDILMKDSKEQPKFNTIQQIVHDKRDVSKEKRFKIDILSSRGLAQLNEAFTNAFPDKILCFEDTEHIGDLKTCKMLADGDNIGVTLAESPLIRKAFLKLQPKTLHDMAICLSIIRPAASDAKQAEAIEDVQKYLVFDDDAINIIRYAVGCKEADADRIRRLLSKPDKQNREKGIKELKDLYWQSKNRDKIALEDVLSQLRGLRKYSFCKSHAYSYAQLCWFLAYMKANYPDAFWKATLNHSCSHYRGWVHKYEAARAGVDWRDSNLSVNKRSIYSEARRKNINSRLNEGLTDVEQLRKTGVWNFTPKTPLFIDGCYGFLSKKMYRFRGIIASVRVYSNYNCNIFLCVGPGKYIEVHFSKNLYVTLSSDKVGLCGCGIIKNSNPLVIQCGKFAKLYSF